jgi:HAMP domain-containing protein
VAAANLSTRPPAIVIEREVRRFEQEVRRFEQEVRRFEQEVRRFEQEVRRSGGFLEVQEQNTS